ncbi:hypothetical protein [Rossellomorea vietnamensis]|nr:hypothetical protein [Rossellomorea vietnamensis]
MLVDRIGAEEVERILVDIDIINERGGDTVKYFMLILEGLRAA